MTDLAILPILPALGGVIACLATLVGIGLSMLHPRGWKFWVGFVRSQWRGLAVLAAIAATGWGAWSWWPTAYDRRTQDPIQLPRVDWPVFQGSLSRSGSDGSEGPVAGGVVWTARPEYQFLGAPAIAGNVVVAVGNFRGEARCFCWDADSGRELWSGAPDNYRTTLASPVLADGRIYCGEGVHHTSRSRVFCLDPARGSQPVVWEVATDSHVECTPAFESGRIYVAAGEDGLYCLSSAEQSPSSGDQRDGSDGSDQILWHVPGEILPDAETALAVHAGRVYLGLGFEVQALVALDAATGRELRRMPLPLPMFAPPALFAGGLLCGLGPGTLVNAATAGPGEARLVELETLETRWTIPLSASMVQSAAVADEVACVISADGVVRIVNREGMSEATWRSSTPILAAPAIGGSTVYVVSQDGVLTGLSLESLNPRWTVRLGSPGEYIGSPVVRRGRVYVGTPAGLMCVGRPGAREAAGER